MPGELHIVNGASLGGSLQEAGIANVAFWHEALYMGPLSLTDDVTFTKLRTTYWERPMSWVLMTDEASHMLANFTSLIERFQHYDRIVLWFEFDLYDQSMLWYILRQIHIAKQSLPSVFIISPDQISGIDEFRGMGELHPDQLTLLLPTQDPIRSEDYTAGTQLWEAYATENVPAMQDLLTKPNPLPYAKRALQIHLAQLPQPPHMLGDIQLKLLDCITQLGTPSVYQVIGTIISTYERDYGLSDLAVIEWLVTLSKDPRGLIEYIKNGEVVAWDPEIISETSVRIISQPMLNPPTPLSHR